MKYTSIHTSIKWLAVAALSVLLSGCGDEGETTESTGVDTSTGTGNGGGSTPRNPGRLQFSAPSVSVAENAGNAAVTITRTDGTDGAVSVTVASRDGTATAPQDYTAVSTTVTFAAGDSAAKTVNVPVIDNTVDAPDTTLYLTLSGPTGSASLGATREILITINDNDLSAPAAPRAALSAVYKQLRIDWAAVPGATSYRLLKDPTGSAGYAQVGTDLPESARQVDVDVIVHKEDWLNARYVIAACNAAGCTNSTPTSAGGLSTALIGYLKASNTHESQGFGFSVALSADGNTLAVGAPYDRTAATGVGGNPVPDCGAAAPVNCSYGSGAVFVYTRSGSTWSAPTYIKAANIGTANDYDSFGYSVALNGDGTTLVVGAPYEDSGTTGIDSAANEAAVYAGAVYVYSRGGSGWTNPVYLKAPNAEQYDYFGESVALSEDGSTLAVGATGEDSDATGINGANNNLALSAGAAYVYARAGASWSASPAYVKASNTASGDVFGSTVALSSDGNVLAIAAPYENSAARGIDGNQLRDCAAGAPTNCSYYSGAAYVYTRAAGTWSGSPTYVKAPNANPSDEFGRSLALSADGNTLAVGAPNEDGGGMGVGGDPNSDCSNPSPVNCRSSSGAAYVFARAAGIWSASAYVKASNAGAFDNFGSLVSLSGDGNTLAVSAPYESGGAAGVGGEDTNAFANSGAAYVFTRAAGSWGAPVYVKASNPDFEDNFGSGLALNTDGSIFVVGASDEQSATSGFNGSQLDDCESAQTNCAWDSGAVYIY